MDPMDPMIGNLAAIRNASRWFTVADTTQPPRVSPRLQMHTQSGSLACGLLPDRVPFSTHPSPWPIILTPKPPSPPLAAGWCAGQA